MTQSDWVERSKRLQLTVAIVNFQSERSKSGDRLHCDCFLYKHMDSVNWNRLNRFKWTKNSVIDCIIHIGLTWDRTPTIKFIMNNTIKLCWILAIVLQFFYAGITLILGELFLAPKTYHLIVTFLMCEIPNCLAFLLLKNLLTHHGYIMEVQQTICIFAGVFYVATVILIHLLCIYHSIFAVSVKKQTNNIYNLNLIFLQYVLHIFGEFIRDLNFKCKA